MEVEGGGRDGIDCILLYGILQERNNPIKHQDKKLNREFWKGDTQITWITFANSQHSKPLGKGKSKLLRDFILAHQSGEDLDNDIKCWHGHEERGRFFLMVGVENSTAPVEMNVEVSQKARNMSITRSSYPALGYISQRLSISLCRCNLLSYFVCNWSGVHQVRNN